MVFLFLISSMAVAFLFGSESGTGGNYHLCGAGISVHGCIPIRLAKMEKSLFQKGLDVYALSLSVVVYTRRN